MKCLLTGVLLACLLLWGCSDNTPIASNISLNEGDEVSFRIDLPTKFPDKALIFDLSDVPASKTDRDFSDHLKVILTDEEGKTYTPLRVWDVNGQRRDIVADYSYLHFWTDITDVKIVALKQVKVSELRWWNGKYL